MNPWLWWTDVHRVQPSARIVPSRIERESAVMDLPSLVVCMLFSLICRVRVRLTMRWRQRAERFNTQRVLPRVYGGRALAPPRARVADAGNLLLVVSLLVSRSPAASCALRPRSLRARTISHSRASGRLLCRARIGRTHSTLRTPANRARDSDPHGQKHNHHTAGTASNLHGNCHAGLIGREPASRPPMRPFARRLARRSSLRQVRLDVVGICRSEWLRRRRR